MACVHKASKVKLKPLCRGQTELFWGMIPLQPPDCSPRSCLCTCCFMYQGCLYPSSTLSPTKASILNLMITSSYTQVSSFYTSLLMWPPFTFLPSLPWDEILEGRGQLWLTEPELPGPSIELVLSKILEWLTVWVNHLCLNGMNVHEWMVWIGFWATI